MTDSQQIQLRALRAKYLGDPESQSYINDLEKELALRIEEKQMAENPIFKAIFKDAEKKIADINSLLQNDKTLTDRERDRLFNLKEVWTFNFRRFGLVLHNEAIKLLDQTIEAKLAQ